MLPKTLRSISLVAALLFPVSVSANTDTAIEFNSGIRQVQLVELYTSEGCSSCPPADRWLSALKTSPSVWKSFVPVAFHVDYWNYIGWPDRFAKQEYTQRQRRYAAEFGERTIYTPGVRQAGLEWRGWRREPITKATNKVGDLSVRINQNGEASARFTPITNNTTQPYQLTLAVLGMSLETEVKRGENSGKKLKHDYVVLETTTLAGKQSDDAIVWQSRLPKPENSAPNYALAAWVTSGQSQIPIQVTGGVITEPSLID